MQHARVTSFDGSPEYRQQMDRQNERALVAWFAEMHGRTLHARRNARDFGLVHRSVRHSARWCGQGITCKIRCQNKEQNFEGEEAINLCLSQLRKRNTKSKFIKMQWKCIEKN
jgi:hypothetical protein